MIELPEHKEVDKSEKHLPQTFEQLIQMYDLEKIWLYIDKINNYIDSKAINVENSLDSTSETNALSANMGRIINSKIYPIGSIYMSVNNVNPSTLFGGTWEAWGTGRVPVGVDATQTEFNSVEKTGGEKTHLLTVDEMPKHSHYDGTNGSEGISAGSGGTSAIVYYNAHSGRPTTETGGDQTHNNLQPYITCYMWKRTA